MHMSASLRKAIGRLARRFCRDSRGQSVVEFAVALPFMVLMSVGVFVVGMVIDRHLTLGQLVRNAGNMFARGISFDDASTQNKQFLVDAATGMGMTLDGGRSAVYLTLLQMIPETAICGAGPCANAGEVVIAQRFTVGNTSIANSYFGMPQNLLADGNHEDFFDDPDALASAPAALTNNMMPNEILYAVEAFHEPSTLAFQGIFAPELMYSRAFF